MSGWDGHGKDPAPHREVGCRLENLGYHLEQWMHYSEEVWERHPWVTENGEV
jgi:hypothetical protein